MRIAEDANKRLHCGLCSWRKKTVMSKQKRRRSICSKRGCKSFVTCDGLCYKHDYQKNPEKYKERNNTKYNNNPEFREQAKDRAKKRYYEKRDTILKERQIKRDADKEGYRKYCREYYQKNRDKLAERERKSYWAQREHKLQQSRESYQRNKEKIKKRTRKYKKDNPEMVRKFTLKRYKLESETFGITADAYRYAIMAWKGVLMKRDGKKCVYCGKKGKRARLEAHHLIYRKTNRKMALIENNGVILCYKCHKEVHRLNPIKYGKRK